MNDRAPHVVTDSTSDLPVEMAQRLDITVVPCQIHFGDQTFLDGVTITRAQFYDRLRSGERFSTSQPSVGAFAEVYRRLLADGRSVVSIHLASRLSGIYNSAWLAASQTDPERITVIDSQQVSMCVGWLAMHAAQAAQEGRSRPEIASMVDQRLSHLRLLAVIDDLRFLHRGGRVSWASSLVGSLFAIKPIILVRQGQADLHEKARSLARGIERVATLVEELGPLERVAVLHAGAPERAAELAERIARFVSGDRLLVTEAGVIISGHAGPGAVGAACLMAG